MVDINSKDDSGYTVLHIAAEMGYRDILQELLKYPRLNVNEKTPYEEIDIFELRLPLTGDNSKNGGGYTALHVAAGNGHTECVKVLLKHPYINVNEKSYYGDTALLAAAVTASAGAVTVLTENGVDVNAADFLGKTALFYALNPVEGVSKAEKIETAQILVKHMCKMEAGNLDVNASDLQLMVDNNDICAFVEECRNELEVMKVKNIGCFCISFFHMFLKNVDEITFYATRDKSIRDVFKYQNHISEFPIYGTEMNKKLQEACQKAKLQLGSFAFLKYIVNDILLIPSDLPDICFDKVALYLTDKDMSNMIEAKPIAVE